MDVHSIIFHNIQKAKTTLCLSTDFKPSKKASKSKEGIKITFTNKHKMSP